MKVTRVSVELLNGAKNNEVALVDIVLDDTIVIHSIKVRKVNDNFYVSMPINYERKGRKIKNGKRIPWDVVHPTNREFSDYLNGEIIKEYEKVASN